MRIAIVGAGAIGCYVGGQLAASGADVTLVGRPRVRDELARGFTIDGERVAVPPFVTELDELAPVDAALVCVKSGQTAEVGEHLGQALGPDAVVASLQNGMRNDEILRHALPGRPVVAAVVGWNVVARGGDYKRTTSGPLLLEEEVAAAPLVAALARTKIPVETRADLGPERWTKLLVNLNNAVSALSGAPTRQLLLDATFRRAIAALVEEALDVMRAAGIRPARLRGMPPAMLPKLLRLPTPLVRVAAAGQLRGVDPEARASMWEDLERGRPTEVDELNGEIVRLAERTGVAAPLNKRIALLVHAAERTGPGSPRMTAAALWKALTSSSRSPSREPSNECS